MGTWSRREAVVRLPRFVENWLVKNVLEDPRDVIMVSTMANLLAFITFTVFSLFLYPSHLLGGFLVFVNAFFFLERFILALHYAAHRRLFKKKYNILNKIMPYFIAPFFWNPRRHVRDSSHCHAPHRKQSFSWRPKLHRAIPSRQSDALAALLL